MTGTFHPVRTRRPTHPPRPEPRCSAPCCPARPSNPELVKEKLSDGRARVTGWPASITQSEQAMRSGISTTSWAFANSGTTAIRTARAGQPLRQPSRTTSTPSFADHSGHPSRQRRLRGQVPAVAQRSERGGPNSMAATNLPFGQPQSPAVTSPLQLRVRYRCPTLDPRRYCQRPHQPHNFTLFLDSSVSIIEIVSFQNDDLRCCSRSSRLIHIPLHTEISLPSTDHHLVERAYMSQKLKRTLNICAPCYANAS